MQRFKPHLQCLVFSLAIVYSAIISAAELPPGSAYCREYHPGGAYITVEIGQSSDLSGDGHFSKMQISKAVQNTFFESIGIHYLETIDQSISNIDTIDLETAVKNAIGLGPDGSSIARPFDWKVDNSGVQLHLLDVNGTAAFSDSTPAIYITKELVYRIANLAIVKNFGSVDNYKDHIQRMNLEGIGWDGDRSYPDSNDDSNWLSERDFRRKNIVPVGAMIASWKDSYNGDLKLDRLQQFASDLSGALFFIGTHEIGHIKLGHNNIDGKVGCDKFQEIELDADRFAAKMLAIYLFDFFPWSYPNMGSDDYFLFTNKEFFRNYNDAGFGNLNMDGACEYPSPELRAQLFDSNFDSSFRALLGLTMAQTRYDLPNGGASCPDPDEQREYMRALE